MILFVDNNCGVLFIKTVQLKLIEIADFIGVTDVVKQIRGLYRHIITIETVIASLSRNLIKKLVGDALNLLSRITTIINIKSKI